MFYLVSVWSRNIQYLIPLYDYHVDDFLTNGFRISYILNL